MVELSEFHAWLLSELPYISIGYIPAYAGPPDNTDYYLWFNEHETRCTTMYGPSTCRQLIGQILKDLGVTPVRLRATLDPMVGAGRFTSNKGRPIIEVPPFGANGYTLLHEIAHYLEWREVGNDRWCNVYDGRPTHHSRCFKKHLASLITSYSDIFDAMGRFKQWSPYS